MRTGGSCGWRRDLVECDAFFDVAALASGDMDKCTRRGKPPSPTNSGVGGPPPSPASPAGSAGGITRACARPKIPERAAFAIGAKRTPASARSRRQGQVLGGGGRDPPSAREPRRAIGDRPHRVVTADGGNSRLTTRPAPGRPRGS